MSIARIWLALAALALAGGQSPTDVPQTSPGGPIIPDLPHKDFSGATACPVVRVCRGDTVIVRMGEEAKRLGLIGVEVPGLADPTGRAAERFLENLLAGEAVYVEFAEASPAPDHFGCIPAYLFRAPDGLFVNLELVRQGYAAVPEAGAFEYRAVFERLQQRARAAGKGRWGERTTDSQAEAKPGERSPGPDRVPKSEARDGGQSTPASRSSPSPVPGPAAQSGAGGDAADDAVVYITAKGAKYHREGCRHVRKSGRPVSLGEARTRGLTPCSQCKPPE